MTDLEINGMAEEDMVREYANFIRKRLIKNKAVIRRHTTQQNQHFWLVIKGSVSAHGKTPGEALDSLERKLKPAG